MCTAKSAGGQRCYSSTKKSLEVAHTKKVETEIAYQSACDAGAPVAVREDLLRKGLAAEQAYEDALALYASTEQGAADLTARLADAPGWHKASDPIDPNRPDDNITLKTALNEGKYLADRAAETKRAVKAGEMSPEKAAERSEYPNAFAKEHRAKTMEQTVTRIIGQPHALRSTTGTGNCSPTASNCKTGSTPRSRSPRTPPTCTKFRR